MAAYGNDGTRNIDGLHFEMTDAFLKSNYCTRYDRTLGLELPRAAWDLETAFGFLPIVTCLGSEGLSSQYFLKDGHSSLPIYALQSISLPSPPPTPVYFSCLVVINKCLQKRREGGALKLKIFQTVYAFLAEIPHSHQLSWQTKTKFCKLEG